MADEALSEAAVLRTQRNNLLARVLDLEVEVALLQDEMQRLRRGPTAAEKAHEALEKYEAKRLRDEAKRQIQAAV